MIFVSMQRHTADIGTKGTIGTRWRKPPCFAVSDRMPNSTAVPWVPTVPFPAVCISIFDGVFSEVESTDEPSRIEEPLSASGGGDEQASDDDGPWIIKAEAAAMLDELEEVDFDDVPVCSCGRYCDVQTLDDCWHCSQCDPDAEERRKRTQRLLATAERIRRTS